MKTKLTPREEIILSKRQERRTFDEIGQELGISGERACQFEARALEKLRLRPNQMIEKGQIRGSKSGEARNANICKTHARGV